jgi:hypothetical protein
MILQGRPSIVARKGYLDRLLIVARPSLWPPPHCGRPLIVAAPSLWPPPHCGRPLIVAVSSILQHRSPIYIKAAKMRP